MPDGAQAWKIIKPPGSQTDRIAQACDRCRSKKIRCDGKRPHCSQCAAVGFECKTSDKLSRRAFPRGYTESLEDRVRLLETENNKLLNLLDIKDEQMELLAKVESVNNPPSHNNASPKATISSSLTPPLSNSKPTENNTSIKSLSPASTPVISTATPTATTTTATTKKAPSIHEDNDDEEAYVVHEINTLSIDGSYKGSSSGGVFIDAFLDKLKTKNSLASPLVGKLFKHLDEPASSASTMSSEDAMPTPSSIASPDSNSQTPSFFNNLSIPSRMTTDKLTSTFFHEWNSMFTVLDQYAYLEEYHTVMNALANAESSNNYDALKGKETFLVVTLLVLALGSLTSKDKSQSAMAESAKLEADWKRAFTSQLQTTPSLATVQALVLAELYSLHTGHMDDVWHFRMMAVSMTQRLGLHRCHKSLKLHNGDRLPFYEQEMRRRIFWVTYTLDCFSAALLGAPRLLSESDIECALPMNIDDELLRSESSATPESSNMTPMSCPLSVIHFSKCLANILDTIYCSKKTHPYKTVVMLEDQLESWRRELPNDLKFDFSNGSPAAVLAPVHQKSPLLLMFYHYARILIHMPAISTPSLGANSGTRGSASCVAVMQSAKVLIQVGNYLKARSVVPTVPFNPSRSNIFFAALVLYGAVDYSKGGALLSDIKKVMSSAMSHLYSDLQLRRPGCLSPESFQRFEEICDLLLNAVQRKNSEGDDGKPKATRKRRTSTKRDSIAIPAPSPAQSVVTPASIPDVTTPPQEPKKDNSAYSLRDTAIDDLLFLNSLASNPSHSSHRSYESPVSDPPQLPISSIDMFDFVTRAPYQPSSSPNDRGSGLISEDNLLTLSFNPDRHATKQPANEPDLFAGLTAFQEELANSQRNNSHSNSNSNGTSGSNKLATSGGPGVDLLDFLNHSWADDRANPVSLM